MIRREGGRDGTVEVYCDTCPDSLATHRTDFSQAIAAAKREGWRIERRGADWNHHCPSCVEDRREAGRG